MKKLYIGPHDNFPLYQPNSIAIEWTESIDPHVFTIVRVPKDYWYDSETNVILGKATFAELCQAKLAVLLKFDVDYIVKT